MASSLLGRVYNRLRPRYGWLPFILLLAALGCLVLAVLEVEWAPGDGAVGWTVPGGFLLAVLLAHGRSRAVVAWSALFVVGAALVFVLVARLAPPWRVWAAGPPSPPDYWQQQIALFADRAAGWYAAVSSGGRSTETIVFVLALAAAGWLVGAFLAWSAYRVAQPYWGLTLAGVALAANTFYGQSGLYWVVLFFGLAITAATFLNYLHREVEWDRAGVDYSAEVRPDLLIYAAGVSLGLMSLAMTLPAINFRAIAEAFQRQEVVVGAEQTLERAFAGVQRPRTDEGAISAGGLPRAFLLSGDPQLADTVVMTATVSGTTAAPTGLSAFHWRSVSYDVYTGRGWSRSDEREQPFVANQPIPLPDELAAAAVRIVPLTQTVSWLVDLRATRYTVGRPLVFSHDLMVQWRGADDLVGVRGRNNAPHIYTAQSLSLPLDPAALASSRVEDVPPEILARYTSLPPAVPPRVYELARRAAGLAVDDGASLPAPPPYEQARAIEAFLHQYPYSLDVPLPPGDADVVDYFLFDLQEGFCDYYASAMVVMARAVGLPARLAAGFLQQPADAAGVQTVRQINAHSWAEVYFAGYGWVEFEPTAPFAAALPAPSATGEIAPQATYTPPTPAAIGLPPRAPRREVPWLPLLGLLMLALVAWRLWGAPALARRAARPVLDDVQAAFAGLQDSAAAAGYPYQLGQTPAEFAASLLVGLDATEWGERTNVQPVVERLAQLFAARQYGRATSPAAGREARQAWIGVRGPLRRLAWRRRLGRD